MEQITREQIIELLKVAACPESCDNGVVVRDLLHGEIEQCQFCFERLRAIAALQAAEPVAWQSQQAQGEVVAYYDPRPGVDWEYRFLEPDVIEQEDNRKFYTVPLIANQPAPAAVPEGHKDASGLVQVLESIVEYYPHPDIDHERFRVLACRFAEQALSEYRALSEYPTRGVCQNCETALPEGCGGIFAHTGKACRYGENQQEEEE